MAAALRTANCLLLLLPALCEPQPVQSYSGEDASGQWGDGPSAELVMRKAYASGLLPSLLRAYGLHDLQGYGPQALKEATKRMYRHRNFIRFGKRFSNHRNFIRFGRNDGSSPENDSVNSRSFQNSAGSDLPADNKYSKENLNKRSVQSPTSIESFHGRSKRHTTMDGRTFNSNKTDDHKISKRAVPNLFTILQAPQNSIDWSSPQAEDITGFSFGESSHDGNFPSEALQEIQKRAFPRSFLRYGREPSDLHFLRFGRDGSDENLSGEGSSASSLLLPPGLNAQSQLINARNNRNFIRFG